MRVRAPARSSRSVASRSADRFSCVSCASAASKAARKTAMSPSTRARSSWSIKDAGAFLARCGVGPGLVSVLAQRSRDPGRLSENPAATGAVLAVMGGRRGRLSGPAVGGERRSPAGRSAVATQSSADRHAMRRRCRATDAAVTRIRRSLRDCGDAAAFPPLPFRPARACARVRLRRCPHRAAAELRCAAAFGETVAKTVRSRGSGMRSRALPGGGGSQARRPVIAPFAVPAAPPWRAGASRRGAGRAGLRDRPDALISCGSGRSGSRPLSGSGWRARLG